VFLMHMFEQHDPKTPKNTPTWIIDLASERGLEK